MNSTTHPYFVANGENRRETAQVLVGTAEEYGVDQDDIFATQDGFRISQAMSDAMAKAEVDDLEDATPVTKDSSYVIGTHGPGGSEEVAPNSDIATESLATAQGADALGLTPLDEDGDEVDEGVEPYEEWSYTDLKAEVARRDLDTANLQGATLIAALYADDEAQADDTDASGEPAVETE